MPTLTVRSPRAPFALIEIRDSSYRAVDIGTGQVTTQTTAGEYTVILSTAGREVEQPVMVADRDVTIDVDLGDIPSAAPSARSTTRSAAHAIATVALSERIVASSGGNAGVGIVVRRVGGSAPGPLPRWDEDSPAVALFGAQGRLPLSWSGGASSTREDHAEAGLIVDAGPLIATIGGAPSTSIVVPAWRGWQTLVFLPVTDEGIVSSMAVMHVVPLAEAWHPELPLADLFDHLHWSLVERPPATEEAVAALRRRLAGMPPSPLLHLMLAHLVAARGAGPGADDLVVESLALLDSIDANDVVPSDVAALRSTSGSVWSPPLLASAADALIGREADVPGSVVGAAADALASRWASPLWFEWSSASAARALPGPPAFTDTDWRRELTAAATSLQRPGLLDQLAVEHSDPATVRLVAYLGDESRRRRIPPTDVLTLAHPADVVRGAGLPAIAALRALHQIAALIPPAEDQPPDPNRWRVWRRRLFWAAIGALVLGAAGVWFAMAADEDDDPPAPTVLTTSVVVQSTAAPTEVTSEPSSTQPATTLEPTTTLVPNSPPEAGSLTLFALAGTPLDAMLDVADRDGDVVTARIEERADGDVELQPDGSFTYVPPEGSGFVDQFSVVFSDATSDSAPAVVSIEVLPNVKSAAVGERPGLAGDRKLEGETFIVLVTLTGDALRPVEVDVVAEAGPTPQMSAEPGIDFVVPTGPIVVPNTDRREIEFEIETIDDTESEFEEVFIIHLSVRYDGVPVRVDVPLTIVRSDPIID